MLHPPFVGACNTQVPNDEKDAGKIFQGGRNMFVTLLIFFREGKKGRGRCEGLDVRPMHIYLEVTPLPLLGLSSE